MSIKTEITRQLDNNNVQIDVSSNNYKTRYYKVPAAKADEFCANYKKSEKSVSRLSTALFMGGAVLGSSLAYLATKNFSKGVRIVSELIGAVLGAVGSIYGSADFLNKKSDNFLKKYNAQEIFYDDKKFPV